MLVLKGLLGRLRRVAIDAVPAPVRVVDQRSLDSCPWDLVINASPELKDSWLPQLFRLFFCHWALSCGHAAADTST